MNLIRAVLLALAATLAAPAVADVPQKPEIIEVMDLSGEINQFTVSQIRQAVEKANDIAKVKAVVLTVDSPGGGATASANLREELSKIKVPVVAYCPSLCASGAIMAMTAPTVKFIAVGDEAIVGSVGVRAQLTRFNRLLDWAKVDNDTFVSGPLKDVGNPTRAITDLDRKTIQGLVDSLAAKFHEQVHQARPKADMALIKQAGIFVGAEAVKVGLADAVMTREQAVAKAKELSGSKSAFTRDELRKITKDASEAASSRLDGGAVRAYRTWEQSLSEALDMVQEVRSGATVRLEYLAPIR